MKQYLLLGLLLCISMSGFAQFPGRPPMRMEGGRPDAEDPNQSEYFITGQVYDEKNTPMVAVSVRLLSAADSSLINGTGTMTDEMGKFTIKNLKYFGSQPWPYPSGIMIGYSAEYESGTIKLQDEELSAGAFYHKSCLPEIPKKLSIARRLIDAWLEGKLND